MCPNLFWRRVRCAVGRVVHGYRLMLLAGQVYHVVFQRPKNASPNRFLTGFRIPNLQRRPIPNGIDLLFWRRVRGAVGRVVHGYRLMMLAGQVYHGVFPRPKNASPKRFLTGFRIPNSQRRPIPNGIDLLLWRRVRDSNPRYITYTAFRVLHLRPLGQLSVLNCIGKRSQIGLLFFSPIILADKRRFVN